VTTFLAGYRLGVALVALSRSLKRAIAGAAFEQSLANFRRSLDSEAR